MHDSVLDTLLLTELLLELESFEKLESISDKFADEISELTEPLLESTAMELDEDSPCRPKFITALSKSAKKLLSSEPR